MTPTKLDLPIRRGTSFEIELVSQIKKYTYDPAVHTAPADLKRTHAENLEHYGYTYEYIDFASTYDRAELIIRKPYTGVGSSDPLLTVKTPEEGVEQTLTVLELTDKSVKIGISPEDTAAMNYNTAIYELHLIIEEGLTDAEIRAGAQSQDEVDTLVYGNVTVTGDK